MKFWGAAFIGTKSGEIILVNLRNWTVYQRINIQTPSSVSAKNFDYRIDSSSRNIVAMNGNQCYIVQIEHNNTDPRAEVSSPLPLGTNSIYSFVIKQASDDELLLFTISAYSLERYKIDLKTLEHLPLQPLPSASRNHTTKEQPTLISTGLQQLQRQQQRLQQQQLQQQACAINEPISASAASVAALSNLLPTGSVIDHHTLEQQASTAAITPGSGFVGAQSISTGINDQLDISKMDRIVENLFSQINVAFHTGLKEFFNDIKCEINDLNLKVTGLSRDLRKLNLQLQEVSRHSKMDY